MSDQVFHDNFDQLHDTPRRTLQRIAATILIFAIVLTLGLAFLSTNGFTNGTIEEASAQDRRTISAMRDAGILVFANEIQCTLNPHILAHVRWNRLQREYCVTNIELRNMDIDTILPYLPRFAGLQSISAPYEKRTKRDRIASKIQSIESLKKIEVLPLPLQLQTPK